MVGETCCNQQRGARDLLVSLNRNKGACGGGERGKAREDERSCRLKGEQVARSDDRENREDN